MSFPRNPTYKDSGIDWLPPVPAHWNVSRLRHCVESIYSGGTPESGEERFWTDEEDGIPWVAIGDMTREPTVTRTDRCVSNAGLLSKGLRVLPAGTLLYSMYASIGKVATLGIDATINQAILGIVPAANTLSGDFLRYWLIQLEGHLALFSSSNTQDNLNAAKVRSFPVFTPPPADQSVIVRFLDRETAKIDALIAEQQRLMELLQEEIDSRVLSSFHATGTESMRLGTVAHIVSRPVAQQSDESYVRLGLYNRGRGLFHKDASAMTEMGESDFFWIESGDLIISGQFAWEGAVALAGEGDAGCVVSHRYPVVRGIEGRALTEYLFALLCTSHGQFLLNENARGAAGRNRPLNIHSLMKEEIPVPHSSTQEAITRTIHKRRALQGQISCSIRVLQERRSTLIANAVTGQIDVRGSISGEVA